MTSETTEAARIEVQSDGSVPRGEVNLVLALPDGASASCVLFAADGSDVGSVNGGDESSSPGLSVDGLMGRAVTLLLTGPSGAQSESVLSFPLGCPAGLSGRSIRVSWA